MFLTIIMKVKYLELSFSLVIILLLTDGKQIKEFSLASYYSDNMILQASPRGTIVWGYGKPGSHISLSIKLDKYTTTVKENGKWMVTTNPHEATKRPRYYKMKVTNTISERSFSQNVSIELKNIQFGDVWICSEQNNVDYFSMGYLPNSAEIIQNSSATSYERIRILSLKSNTSEKPLEDFDSFDYKGWRKLTTDILSNKGGDALSAMCIMYATKLYDKLQIPIGIIQAAYGGKALEAWCPASVTEDCPETGYYTRNKFSVAHNSLWNAMINPLSKMTIKGVIWYQGETDIRTPGKPYHCLFSNLIWYWRDYAFSQSNQTNDPVFPIGFVQIAGYNKNPYGNWADIQYGQTVDYGEVPHMYMKNTFMVASYDLTELVHRIGGKRFALSKKNVLADRLVWAALNSVYNYTEYPTTGPKASFSYEVGANTTDIKIIYTEKVELHGNHVFSFNCVSKNKSGWQNASSEQISSTEIIVTPPLHCPFTEAAYFWNSTPCNSMKCGVHAVDKYELPAPIHKWIFADTLNAHRDTTNNKNHTTKSNTGSVVRLVNYVLYVSVFSTAVFVLF